VVVLDFTAEWCLNCKALKAAVLDVEPVKSRVREEGVVTMTVDLTSTSAPGWEKLRALGQTGIPTLAIYGPGIPKDAPIISNAYTAAQVLEWLEQARGDAVAAR
jgi:thiol:disulfide interchange protein